MVVIILITPIIGFLSGILFGNSLGNFVCFITTFGLLLSFIISLLLLTDNISTGAIFELNMGYWIKVDSFLLYWCFFFDSLTLIMSVVITCISLLVHIFSIEYMGTDPHLVRFMAYLSLFTFFMLILVTASNFLQMFVGWEGVGLCSYLLINFWFTRIQANKAAIKAMLVNRVGDFFILIGFFSLYMTFSTLDYGLVFALTPFTFNTKFIINTVEISVSDFTCVLLILGAMGKSAQIAFHTWLPDAMEGPTPVSALIHAATMVTAGVFLLVRCSPFFEYSQFSLNTLICVGSTTAFFAATSGLFQNDLKRVIAFSTCSQLGYMIFACGLSSYEVAIFHLSNHAFFKALLFLGAGSIIHAVSNEQDIRNMGGLLKILPFSYSSIAIGSFTLIGFPFLSGYYSKDAILEVAFAKYVTFGHFAFFFGVSAALCTCFYSIHLLFLVFLSTPNSVKIILANAFESRWKIKSPLFLLAFLSLITGFFTREALIGFGSNFWGATIFVAPKNFILIDIEFISTTFKLIPLFAASFGFLTAVITYKVAIVKFFELKKISQFQYLYTFLIKKWYFDRIFNQFLNQAYFQICYHFAYKDVDRGFVERFGPSGIVVAISHLSLSTKKLQSGYVFHYLLMFALSIVVFGINMLGDGLRDLLDPRLRGGLGRYQNVDRKIPSKIR